MTHGVVAGLTVAVLFAGLSSGAGHAADEPRALAAVVAEMDGRDGLGLAEQGRFVPEGPGGRTVLRCDKGLETTIDLRKLGIDPRQYDLLKIEMKADRGATLHVTLENHPVPGQLAHWFALDAARGEFDWRTLWIDLRRPEAVHAAGKYKGMVREDPDARGLRFHGGVKDLKRSIQPPGRTIWLGRVRLVRKAVDLDWDQTQAPCTWGKGKDLVYSYPLRVTNRLDRPVTAMVSLRPFQVTHATATVSHPKVTLGPKQSKVVEARIVLSAAVAAKAAPLYCERFEARAAAEGLPDSDVTILRSADPIHLSVTVPIDESRLSLPLLLRSRDLPDAVTGLNPRLRDAMAAVADAARPEDLDAALDGPLDPDFTTRQKGFYGWGGSKQAYIRAGSRYLNGLTACAFLYDRTSERKYLDKGTALLLRAARLWPVRHRQWAEMPAAPISHGIFSRACLCLGWATGGTMRSPYHYHRHGMFNDFDLLAADMDPAARRQIIDGFILPAAVQMRNHYVGLGNQQDCVNYPVMYAGMLTRNWPLVAFAHSSEHGVLAQIRWDLDDAGLCTEVNYQVHVIRPILRAAEAVGQEFRDGIGPWLDTHRFAGKGLRLPDAAGGLHATSGLTLLRHAGVEVAMNWDVQLNRSAPDRCCLRVAAAGKDAPRFLNGIGGGNYTKSSLGQSVVIVDEGVQRPVRADVTGYQVQGPVQYVQATSDRHFPGAKITRTFALIGRHVLIVDRVTSTDGRPHTVDWCLRYAGGAYTHQRVAEGLSLKTVLNPGSFTDKPDDPTHGVSFGRTLWSKAYYVGTADGLWRQKGACLTMAGEPGTEVMCFAVAPAYSAWRKEKETGVPVLMARRKDVRQTDFVTALSEGVASLECIAVRRADGGSADAVGVKVALTGGEVFHAIVNYEPPGTNVKLETLATAERFAADYEEEK